ncbi:MAG: ADP-ribosylglycohydrolase family protein [Spirochaetales bacterium]|nr:ADP-ribosylglycohydrolase family protein [Spirochaetales bacterium]MCF7938542.1 ADP-ribosylglycohydrolase family protein [Spirochaetales bacterium]
MITEEGKTPGTQLSDRIRGMLYGLAIGDALGNTSESMSPSQRKDRFGEISDYLPNHHKGGETRGFPSDDTQMAFWTLENMLEHRGVDPLSLAETFAGNQIFGIGSTVRAFISAYKADRNKESKDWQRWGRPSAGNGSLMRIAPLALTEFLFPEQDLEEQTRSAASLTHNDPAANASCLAFARMYSELIAVDRSSGVKGEWWIDRYVTIASEEEGDSLYEARGGQFQHYRGPIWKFVDAHVREALALGLPIQEACNSWYSGAYLLETVPSVLYILSRHGEDPKTALIRAVNDTRDNDTIAAIVGAAVGAACGLSAFPESWVHNLSGQVYGNDDGKVQELVEKTVDAANKKSEDG